MNITRKLNKANGFTLIELMIALAIVAIIASIAYPAYTDSTTKARRADAKGAMMGFAQAMERHFTENNTYLGAANGGGNTGAPGIYPTEAPIDGNQKHYDLTIQAATATSYTLRATPKNGQAGDGNLEITHTGVKTWDGNAGWD